MKPITAVLALINSMIGSVIMVLPPSTINAGIIPAIMFILATCLVSYYSSYLYLSHLGPYSDFDEAIYYHFDKSKLAKKLYNALIFMCLLITLIIFFKLIVIQWTELLSENDKFLITITNAIALFLLVSALNFFYANFTWLSFGIFATFAFCIFLLDLLAQSDGKQ